MDVFEPGNFYAADGIPGGTDLSFATADGSTISKAALIKSKADRFTQPEIVKEQKLSIKQMSDRAVRERAQNNTTPPLKTEDVVNTTLPYQYPEEQQYDKTAPGFDKNIIIFGGFSLAAILIAVYVKTRSTTKK